MRPCNRHTSQSGGADVSASPALWAVQPGDGWMLSRAWACGRPVGARAPEMACLSVWRPSGRSSVPMPCPLPGRGRVGSQCAIPAGRQGPVVTHASRGSDLLRTLLASCNTQGPAVHAPGSCCLVGCVGTVFPAACHGASPRGQEPRGLSTLRTLSPPSTPPTGGRFHCTVIAGQSVVA